MRLSKAGLRVCAITSGEIMSDTEWVIVGSSPTAPKWLEAVRQNTESPQFAVTNRAHVLFPDDPPDIYFIGGEVTGNIRGRYEQFYAAARDIQKRGSHLVSLQRRKEEIKEAGLDFMDEYLLVDVGRWGKWKFIPGHYSACGFSGLFCLQYAVNHGASIVHCVGMEGYAKEGHYFDAGPDSVYNQTDDVIGPFTQAVIDACPGVEFIFYGELNYPVVGANVRLVSELPVEVADVMEAPPDDS